MNPSNTFSPSTSFSPLAQPRAGASPAPTMNALWIAIAFLGLCVLAIGGTLIRQQPGAATGMVPLAGAQAMLAPSQLASRSSSPNTMINAPAAKKVAANAKAPTQVAQASGSSNGNVPAPTTATCTRCGTIEAVTPFTRQGQASGVGMVGGAVVGGVLGNQVGKGSGRAVATVLGAAGGGWAGNTIEKNMKKTTAYSVRVRMQDGTSRVIEQSAAPMVGSKVTVDGGTLHPA